jgi:hypothetical protein
MEYKVPDNSDITIGLVTTNVSGDEVRYSVWKGVSDAARKKA